MYWTSVLTQSIISSPVTGWASYNDHDTSTTKQQWPSHCGYCMVAITQRWSHNSHHIVTTIWWPSQCSSDIGCHTVTTMLGLSKSDHHSVTLVMIQWPSHSNQHSMVITNFRRTLTAALWPAYCGHHRVAISQWPTNSGHHTVTICSGHHSVGITWRPSPLSSHRSHCTVAISPWPSHAGHPTVMTKEWPLHCDH